MGTELLAAQLAAHARQPKLSFLLEQAHRAQSQQTWTSAGSNHKGGPPATLWPGGTGDGFAAWV